MGHSEVPVADKMPQGKSAMVKNVTSKSAIQKKQNNQKLKAKKLKKAAKKGGARVGGTTDQKSAMFQQRAGDRRTENVVHHPVLHRGVHARRHYEGRLPVLEKRHDVRSCEHRNVLSGLRYYPDHHVDTYARVF